MWAAEAYAQACFHSGFQLDQGILDALTNGLLMLDLRLCAPASLSATCSTLREKPTGIRQTLQYLLETTEPSLFLFCSSFMYIASHSVFSELCAFLFPVRIVFRDGMRCFRNDLAYRKHAVAKDRQFGKYAFNTSHLRMLLTALAVFLSARGQKVWILDLEGVPLGKQLTSLLAPLAATLTQTGARHLQWLNLSGCQIGDRGLALLLPALVGKTLPELEAILLAENHLSDVQLVIHLLRSRTQLCTSCAAASLRLLDLSQNPRLTEPRTKPGEALMLSISRHRMAHKMARFFSLKNENQEDCEIRSCFPLCFAGSLLRVFHFKC